MEHYTCRSQNWNTSTIVQGAGNAFRSFFTACLFILSFVGWFIIVVDDNIQKDEEVEFYREKFAGSQSDRADRALKAETDTKKMAEQLNKTKISG